MLAKLARLNRSVEAVKKGKVKNLPKKTTSVFGFKATISGRETI